jgi:hypothetical protein
MENGTGDREKRKGFSKHHMELHFLICSLTPNS